MYSLAIVSGWSWGVHVLLAPGSGCERCSTGTGPLKSWLGLRPSGGLAASCLTGTFGAGPGAGSLLSDQAGGCC